MLNHYLTFLPSIPSEFLIMMCKCDFIFHRNIQMICSAAFHLILFLLQFANESNGRVHWRIFLNKKKTIQIKSLFKRNVQRVEMSVIHVIYNDVHFWMKNVSNDVYDWLRIFSLALDTKMLLKSKPLRSFEVSQLKCYTIKLIPGHKCTINNFCKCFIDGITHTLVLLQISCQNSVVFLWINR